MDSSQDDPFVLELEKVERELNEQKMRVSDVISCSDTDDEERPLSHAEESAIEECLNDTEGSLSSVDLNIFDDISDDLHVQSTQKSRTQRTPERMNMSFSENGTDCDSSVDESKPHKISSLTGNSLDNSISIIDVARKRISRAERNQRAVRIYREAVRSGLIRGKRSKNERIIIRRKRRNSPPIKKNDRTHIYSFFSAMADLVSTLPDEYEIRAKQNVNVILEEVVDKFKDWHLNTQFKDWHYRPRNSEVLFGLLQYRIAKLQKIE